MLNARNDKSLVIIIVRDHSGCSHVRLRWNAMYYNGFDSIGFTPIITPQPIFDATILKQTKAIIYQRPIGSQDIAVLQEYKIHQKKFGYKIVFECDDQIFDIDGEGLPEYNMASEGFNKDLQGINERVAKAVSLCDEIAVSTDYLKDAFIKKFNCQNIRVIRNVVPRFLWSYPRKPHITEDLKKPKIIYTGSPCHYRNPCPPKVDADHPDGILANLGDFDCAWKDWIIKMVKEDKIEFTVVGSQPYFFAEIANKIKQLPWKDTTSYPRQVLEEHADFAIAPIVENQFNKCKSSLRFIEACAAGSLLLGTVFKDNKFSPYEDIADPCKFYPDVTMNEIDERFWALCKKDNYNAILDWQYDQLNNNGWWMESTKHADEWMSMIDGNPNEKFI